MSPVTATVPDRILLQITRAQDNGYALTLTLPDGSAAPEARLDLAALLGELEALERTQPVWSSRDPSAYGRILYRHLFPDPLGFHYAQAVGAAGYRGVQLLLALDPHAPALHRVPWERLFQPGGSGWKPAGASPDIFLSRYLSPPGAGWRTPLGAGPLRMLAVIANPYPEGHQRHFDGDAAWRAIADAVAPYADRVILQRMEGPITLERLIQALAEGDFHILHLTGHGVWDEQDGRAHLILEQEQDGRILPDKLAAEDLIARLQPLPALPQLITLAACESAFPGTKDALAGLAPQLILAGCPAVVGMQEEVRVEAAHAFYRTFYDALLKTGFVDQAVTQARAALYAPDAWEWAIPALTMRLSDGLLFLPDEQFRPAHRAPYKFLAPYTPADADIFEGRDALSRHVTQRINDYRVTVLYGEPGAGVTSLLEAGVRPKLEEAGDLVIRVDEYEDIASEARLHVRWRGRPLRLSLRGDAPLEEVLRAISGHAGRRIVLMLDQFERAFTLPKPKQDALADAVVAAMAALQERLKLVIAMHTGYLGDFAALQERFEAIAQPWIETPVLDRDAAAEAIVGPLQALQWPVTIQPEFARDQIARDLDALYEPEKEPPGGSVNPAQLQIVCYWLYEEARKQQPPQIDEELYVKKAGGAEGILTRYMQQTLATRLADERALAEQILVQMAAPRAPLMVRPDDLTIEGATRDRVAAVLDRMAEARLLIRRRHEGRIAYAFANVIVAQEARNLGGEALRLRYLAEDELERIWRMWIAAVAEEEDPASPADQALPNPDQLRLLARARDSLAPLPIQALMLLRAAVKAHDIALQPWFGWVQSQDAVDLLRRLDAGAMEDANSACGAVAVDRAVRLLGLSAEGRRTSGALARAAALHPDGVSRQTAALALAALAGDQTVARLKTALHEHVTSAARWRRAAQLFGALADAGAVDAAALSLTDRIGAWGWRVWRRLVNQRHVLGMMVGGAAVGVSILFALFRFLSSAVTLGFDPGIQLGMGLWWGLIMGAFLALGLLLTDFLTLRVPWRRRDDRTLARRLLISLGGGVGFALSLAIISSFAGLNRLDSLEVLWRTLRTSFLVFLLMLPPGFGAALALSDHPWKRQRLSMVGWLARLGVLLITAIVTLFLLQNTTFSLHLSKGKVLQLHFDRLPGVGMAGASYTGYLTKFRTIRHLKQSNPRQFARLEDALEFFDLFMTLLTLFLGVLIGMRWGWRRSQEDQDENNLV